MFEKAVEEKEKYILSKDNFLIELLGGRIERDIITSIYGSAGTGKTTLALQLAREIIRNDKEVYLIDTEGGFSVERALQIVGSKETLSKLWVRNIFTFNELEETIGYLKNHIDDRNIGGLIIDSISQPYRLEMGEEVFEINKRFSRLFYILAKLAKTKSIPIITTHQVYVDFNTNKVEIVGRDIPKYASKTMILLEKENEKRWAELKKHRYLNSRVVKFKIKDVGIVKDEG